MENFHIFYLHIEQVQKQLKSRVELEAAARTAAANLNASEAAAEDLDEPTNTIYLDLMEENVECVKDVEASNGGCEEPTILAIVVHEQHSEVNVQESTTETAIDDNQSYEQLEDDDDFTNNLTSSTVHEIAPPNKNKKSELKTKNKTSTNTLEDDELIRNWCEMHCTMCAHTFHRFPEVKTHYRDKHQRNGFITCCKRKFFRRVRVLEHIGCHINPNLFRYKTVAHYYLIFLTTPFDSPQM